jgi:hypothetical protein
VLWESYRTTAFGPPLHRADRRWAGATAADPHGRAEACPAPRWCWQPPGTTTRFASGRPRRASATARCSMLTRCVVRTRPLHPRAAAASSHSARSHTHTQPRPWARYVSHTTLQHNPHPQPSVAWAPGKVVGRRLALALKAQPLAQQKRKLPHWIKSLDAVPQPSRIGTMIPAGAVFPPNLVTHVGGLCAFNGSIYYAGTSHQTVVELAWTSARTRRST